MKERPILFSGPMVKAILENRKTQTRRVIKPQPSGIPESCKIGRFGGWAGGLWSVSCPRKNIAGQDVWVWQYNLVLQDSSPGGHIYGRLPTPYGQPGNRLWVRETFAKNIPWYPHGLTYRVDHIDARGDGPAHPIKWRPSIFMPRWASRITLEITDIRVERVQDISDDDAKAEGVMDIGIKDRGGYRSGFADLWDSTNAKQGFGWEQNPWVWVIEFKVS